MPVVVLVVVATGLGVLTSFGQTYLPDELRSLANSAAPWCVVAFALALLARRTWTAVLFAVAAFVLLLLGYEVASTLRLGFGMAPATWAFWLACTVVVGPVLGLVAAWGRRDPGLGRSAAVSVVAGIAVGDGLNGVLFLPTTSPAWWTISIVLGLAGLVVFGWLGRAPRQVLLATAGTVVVAAALAAGYQVLGGVGS